MTISKVKVEGTITLPDGQSANIKSITFRLTGSDFENGEYIAKKSIAATHNGEGEFSVDVWPNDAGYFADTKYQVVIELNDGAVVDPVPPLYIRKERPIHDFDLLVIEQENLVTGYQNRVISKQLFDSMTNPERNMIYLVTV